MSYIISPGILRLRYFLGYTVLITVLSLATRVFSSKPPERPRFSFSNSDSSAAPGDSVVSDTLTGTVPDSLILPYPFSDDYGDAASDEDEHPLYLSDPAGINKEFVLDSTLAGFSIYEKLGEHNYRHPSYISYDDFMEMRMQQSVRNYWKQKAGINSVVRKDAKVSIAVPGKAFETIFGSNRVQIRPTGSFVADFAGQINKTENPQIPTNQQTQPNFNFDQQIQLNVTAEIGDKLKLNANHNTEAIFDFQNQLKLEYAGFEDEIIRKIEAGNVNMPVGSQLISGGQNLFGIKTQLQFGRLTITSVASQQRGKREEKTVKAGGQSNTVQIEAYDYDTDRNFFLAQYFYENYDTALSSIPLISSPVSVSDNLRVWRLDLSNSASKTRYAIAFMDLAEPNPFNTAILTGTTGQFPDNSANDFASLAGGNFLQNLRDKDYSSKLSDQDVGKPVKFSEGSGDFVFGRFRQLDKNEYSIHPELGYISLDQPLQDQEALAVSYVYSLKTSSGTVNYEVGDVTLPANPSDVVILKLIRPKKHITANPTWNLMMKNIYSTGGYDVSRQNFKFDITYLDAGGQGKINFLPSDKAKLKSGVSNQLLQLMKLDNLNVNNEAGSDGVFDFISGVTIDPNTGRVIFPVTEPFGSHLKNQFEKPEDATEFVFNSLYENTKNSNTIKQDVLHDRYSFNVEYQASASSEIDLQQGMIVEGSVKVYQGSVELQENVDYTVNYDAGKVRIINQAILTSGQELKATFETNSLFGIQTRTLVGSRFDYFINKNFTLGSTVLHLNERPITKKINIGDEPISNTIWGLDGSYKTESMILTKFIDKLPLLETKSPSVITLTGEFAQLNPGHPKVLNDENHPNGVSIIDDFDHSKIPIDLGLQPYEWKLASTPERFPESSDFDLPNRYNCAKLSWYKIDNSFYDNKKNLVPAADQKNSYTRFVKETEIFPNKAVSKTAQRLATFDLHYEPKIRGPYNFRAGNLQSNGELLNPAQSWSGIMKPITTNTDFESTNIEFIEFWVLDPCLQNSGNSGKIYINLGDINEDVLKDGEISFENGLPENCDASGTISTSWGNIPQAQTVVSSFANDEESRKCQDVGHDGLPNSQESAFFQNFLNSLSSQGIDLSSDPSSDNYQHFLTPDNQEVPVLERYTKYNNPEGNSPITGSSDYSTSATPEPDKESLEREGQMSTADNYYEYEIILKPSSDPEMQVGQNFITDKITIQNPNDATAPQEVWYQFKVPVSEPTQVVGDIQDFKSIRFVRLYLTDFKDEAVIRFGRLQLVGGEWRRITGSLLDPADQIGIDDSKTTFDITTVDIEENGTRTPVNYVLPPGIKREELDNPNTGERLAQNEGAIALRISRLQDGDARGAYKDIPGGIDLRLYEKLKLFVHSELDPSDANAEAFIRMGTDYTSNYYQYEVKLVPTPPGLYDANSYDAQRKVWPVENEIDFNISRWNVLKQERDLARASTALPFSVKISQGVRMTVVGSPDLSNIRKIVLGVRNPKDDGQEIKTLEVWMNELQVTDFKEDPGWSALATAKVQLADFGSITLNGSRTTFGYGSLEKKITERTKEDNTSYFVKTDLDLGHFFPKTTGVLIPMYVDYGENISRPQYNPTNPDILMEDALEATDTPGERDSLREISEKYSDSRTISFTGVRKTRVKAGGKPHFYNISNWTFSYAYAKGFRREPTIRSLDHFSHSGSARYEYDFNPKSISPFKSGIFAKSKSPLTTFNFYYLPKKWGVGMQLNRKFEEKQLRIKSSTVEQKPIFTKSFEMTRTYDFAYNFSRSLGVTFKAENRSTIDEPEGRIDTKEKKDTLYHNLLLGGRNTVYNHSVSSTYALPTDKIKLLEWIKADFSTVRTFRWDALPKTVQNLGHLIQNSNNYSVNGQLSLIKLYNRVPLFKSIVSSSPSKPVSVPAKKDSVPETQTESLMKMGKGLLRILLTVRDVQFNYSNNRGQILPGYVAETDALGYDFFRKSPTAGFLLGSQEDLRSTAHERGWVTESTGLLTPYERTSATDFSANTSMEPFKNFKVKLKVLREQTSKKMFYLDESSREFNANPKESGSFSMSMLTLYSAFERDKEILSSSKAFDEFQNSRVEIADRLAGKNPNYSGAGSGGYPAGYGKNSQDVLIPAFLAAYGWGGRQTIGLSYFPAIPLPNWDVDYRGLSNLPFFKKYFNNVTLSHAYSSTYSVQGYNLDPNYVESEGFSSTYDANGNFYPKYNVGQIVITENLSPFIGVKAGFLKNMNGGIEIKRDRTLTFNFSDMKLLELKNKAFSINASYRVTAQKVPIKVFGKKIYLKHDMDFLVNFSVRDSKTRIRKVDTLPQEKKTEITSGSKIYSLEPKIDYVINSKLDISIFFKQDVTRPHTNNIFRTSFISTGIRVEYRL